MIFIVEVEGQYHESTTMKVDNIATINLVRIHVVHGSRKHIKMRFNYLREQVNNGRLCLEHCRSENQIADIMTKAMQVKLFKKLRSLMVVQSLTILNNVLC